MSMPDDFAALILTHGRPGRVVTLNSLARAGYTGRWYLVVDDGDATRPEYIKRYGQDRVLTFSKAEIAKTMDLADGGGSDAYARGGLQARVESLLGDGRSADARVERHQ